LGACLFIIISTGCYGPGVLGPHDVHEEYCEYFVNADLAESLFTSDANQRRWYTPKIEPGDKVVLHYSVSDYTKWATDSSVGSDWYFILPENVQAGETYNLDYQRGEFWFEMVGAWVHMNIMPAKPQQVKISIHYRDESLMRISVDSTITVQNIWSEDNSTDDANVRVIKLHKNLRCRTPTKEQNK